MCRKEGVHSAIVGVELVAHLIAKTTNKELLNTGWTIYSDRLLLVRISRRELRSSIRYPYLHMTNVRGVHGFGLEGQSAHI